MGASRTFTEYEELASAAQRAYEVRRAGEAAEDVVRRVRARGESGADVPPFAHLTARTGYSLRDGVIRPRELASAAAAAGMTHVAVTDRDGLYGAVRFANAAAAEGVVGVLGTDLALEPEPDRPGWSVSRHGRRRERGDARPGRGPAWLEDDAPRVTLLARDRDGFSGMCRAVTAAHLGRAGVDSLLPGAVRAPSPGARSAPPAFDSSQWRQAVALDERGSPHLRWHDLPLATADDGCFVLLGPDSPVGRLLAADRREAAAAELRRWLEVVGTDRLRLAVTHHRTPPRGRRLGPAVRHTLDGVTFDEPGDDARVARTLALAADVGVGVVATNDVRYLVPDDAHLADVLRCVRQQVPLGRHHLGRTTAEGWFTTPAEMAERFAERPDLLTAAHDLAVGCDVDLGIGELQVPRLTGLADEVAAGELHRRCWAGVAERFDRVTPKVRERLERELDMVDRLGLHDYFLTVGDIMAAVRSDLGILASCRGSAAGSLVCYALRISDVDPVANDLAFERFMNPYRDELPDIDIDVESARREDVYDLVIARYGQHRTACVAMVETFQARMAIREVGKVLGLPPDEIGQIASGFTHARARDTRQVMQQLPELAGANLDVGRLDTLFRIVERIDGLPRHLAMHPCGILLASEDLLGRTPIERSAQGFPMTCFDKDDVADLGWLKLDVLGVRMLSAMRHAIELVPHTRGHDFDVDDIPDGDRDTYRLVQSTHTIGMFQIESPGQRELIGRLLPDDFGDLITEISLFRPGPVKADMVTPFVKRRHRQEAFAYPHPSLEPVLRETHGVIVYHEQVMGALCALTGCDMSYADLLRRQLSDDTKVHAMKAWALARARDRGFSDEDAEAVWKQVASFASFGFCKAHAAAFAVPTYRSAWMKAHLFPEMMAGLLTHDPGMYPRRLILDECRNFGVAVLPPDVNRSLGPYTVEVVDRGQAEHRLGLRGDRLPPGWTEEPEPPLGEDRGVVGRLSRSSVADGGGRRRRWRGTRAVPPSGFDCSDAGNGYRYAVRVGLQDLRGITDAEIASLTALDARPFTSLRDVRERARLSRPTAEHLAMAGALDHVAGVGRRGGPAHRRELRLVVEELWRDAASRPRHDDGPRVEQVEMELHADHRPVLDPPSGAEVARQELKVLGLDVSRHVVSFYEPLLEALGVVRAADLFDQPTQALVRVAGVKVAVQSPAQRSGNRVLFLSLDDRTGSTQVTYFSSTLEDCAWTVMHAWLLVAEGRVSRRGSGRAEERAGGRAGERAGGRAGERARGRRGVTVTGTRAWDLSRLWRAWQEGWLPDALAESGTPAPHLRTTTRPEGLQASEWGRGSR
jgi:error-prone DNA polymerase